MSIHVISDVPAELAHLVEGKTFTHEQLFNMAFVFSEHICHTGFLVGRPEDNFLLAGIINNRCRGVCRRAPLWFHLHPSKMIFVKLLPGFTLEARVLEHPSDAELLKPFRERGMATPRVRNVACTTRECTVTLSETDAITSSFGERTTLFKVATVCERAEFSDAQRRQRAENFEWAGDLDLRMLVETPQIF